MKTPQSFTFPNGFRVIHERPRNRLGISALQVFVDFGSAHESVRGSAHFIEHMCFKGTRDFPSYSDLFLQQHRLGNMFNAITDQRYTVYTCKVNDEDLYTAIHLLSSMMLESTFPQKDFVSEERVVIEECLRSDDDGEVLVQQDCQSMRAPVLRFPWMRLRITNTNTMPRKSRNCMTPSMFPAT